jgi:muramoyltetrapeptide carboxypeptidase
MNRRELLKVSAALAALASPIFGRSKRAGKIKIVKPKRLSTGDTVAVIAPAGAADDAAFDKALQNLQSLGLKGKIGKNARAAAGFLAGTDRQRLDDLHAAFADREVSAVWCVRGGYGATRLLPDIDYNLIRKNPKILLGFSDITALHLAVWQKTGLVAFHGPVASSELSDYTRKHLENVLMNPSANYKIELSDETRTQESNLYKTEIIAGGKCRGRLTGGNLSLLAAMAGTPFALGDVKNKILFIEDVGEAPYRVDRMLTQLRQSADLRQLSGVALGVFADSNPKSENTQSLLGVLKDRLGDLGVPVVYGLSFGHIRDKFTLPVGVEAELDTAGATVTLLEAAVG